ncbi:Rhs family protein [Pseudomonas helleri]|uniref:Rhs family protein n=1 Tax=Pseudomonas helleri TaxID=1608996 RepID=A0A7X1WDU7_9PSED|nr:RHS repeat-associated core domain-containing protein [Pseudomonas helleri]MQT49932.1 Rhs family protein [Pseudomonas helleri]
MNSPATRPRQSANSPINTVTKDDIEASKEKLDQWLRKLTNDTVSWNMVHAAGSVIPGVGTVFAGIDAIGDLLTLIEGDREDFLTWVSLGINVVGLVSFPGVGPARLAVRTTLSTVRKNGLAVISAAMLTALEENLNDKTRGALEDFAVAIQTRLSELLAKIAAEISKACAAFAQMLRSIASDDGQKTLANKTKTASLFAGPLFAIGAHFLIDDRLLSKSTCQELLSVAKSADDIGKLAAQKVTSLGDAGKVGSIGNLIAELVSALARRKRRGTQPASVAPQHVNHAQAHTGQGGMVTQNTQRHTDRDPGCKNKTASSTGCSISFATGSETVAHADFSLPGPFPVEWVRTYRSSLDALDHGSLGARWITPFTTRIAVNDTGLIYLGTDGRNHRYPNPKLGKHHYDAVEGVLLVRNSATTLVIARGHDSQEHYQQLGDHYALSEITLRGGARVTLHYDHQHAGQAVLSDLITHQGETPHQHIHTQLDDHGRINALWLMHEGAPLRQLAGYDYDEHGDLRASRDEHAAQWAYQYQHHLITRYTDRTGRGMNLQWQGDGPDAKAVREWADDGSYDTRLEWDANIRLTYVTDALGQETWHYYDILGYTYRIIYPDGNEEWLFRDAAKNVTRHIHTDGSTDSYAYDERGNLLQHTRADGSSIHHAYDDQDQRFKTRDAEGGLWKYDYDPRGNIIETLDPLENTTCYVYNSDNLPVLITDALGGNKHLAYNADGQLTRYTDCSGKVSQWQYNALGQLSRFTDAAGNITAYHYSAGQLVRLTLPDNTEEHFERDAEGRLLSHTDALRQRTMWHYNEAGLIQQRQQADGSTLAYRWDKLGQLLELRNENNSTATFAYDPAGKLLSETGFDRQTIHYQYENGSQQPTHRSDGDRVWRYDYDPLGRLSARHAAYQGGKQWQTETFAYDGNGNLLLATNPTCKLQWFYDAAGNNTREHQHLHLYKPCHVAIWQHEYDALNQRIATTRPDGHRVSWLTYGSGHLLAMKVDDIELLSYQRDDLHREIVRHQGNGLQQRQSWTPNGQLQEQTVALTGSSTRLLVRNYRYDDAGQLTDLHDNRRGDINYRYDPLGRLLGASSQYKEETFAFDPASNLLDPKAPRRPIHHPPPKLLDNLLRDYVGQHYTYDARGNLLERLDNGKKARFTWDLYDRLTRYEDDRLTADFAYDALGRRVAKYSKAHCPPSPGAGPAWIEQQQRTLNAQYYCGQNIYGWDGDTLAYETRYSDNPGERRLIHYFYEPGSFIPVAQTVENRSLSLVREPSHENGYHIDRDPLWQHQPVAKPFNAIAWYQCDHLGTPMELTDQRGEIAWSGTYQAWGLAKEKRTGSAIRENIRNPLRFQGQYFDTETGLHYNRYRYYDPQVGRFISKDPIGFAGGLNVYAYAPNPVGWVDPFGLNRTNKQGHYHGPKPKYHNPGHHDLSSGNFRGGGSKTSIIPQNAEQLYKRAIPDVDGRHWYAMDEDGVIHRFGNSNDGNVHWNGDSSQGRGVPLPPEIEKRFNAMRKDCICGVKKR